MWAQQVIEVWYKMDVHLEYKSSKQVLALAKHQVVSDVKVSYSTNVLYLVIQLFWLISYNLSLLQFIFTWLV